MHTSSILLQCDREAYSVYLPLKGGGRRAKRAGWGSSVALISGPPPDRLAPLRRPTSPFQGEVTALHRLYMSPPPSPGKCLHALPPSRGHVSRAMTRENSSLRLCSRWPCGAIIGE